jgi:hypothetical protein
MGAWSMLIALGLTLVIVGLYTHWAVSLVGAILPLWVVAAELRRRRSRLP